jgi:hypothetical protein
MIRILIIRCAKCNSKVFKYLKVGKGRVLKCWKNRIQENHTIQKGKCVICPCGNIIGTDIGPYIKIKQHSIIY